MKKICMLLLAIAMICIFSISVTAAPIGAPAKAKEMKGKDYIYEDLNIAFLMGGEVDYINEMALDKADTEVEGAFYTAKLAISMDMVDVYAMLGQTRDVEYSSMVSGADIKYKMEDEFTWGTGVSALIYEWKRFGLKFCGDVKYRTISDMDYGVITLEGLKYGKEKLTEPNKTKAKWEEWQAAFSVAKKLGYIMPYVGVKYTDVDVSAKVTLDTITYDLGTVSSGDSIGVFVGCSLLPLENLSVDLEARFFDEEAFSVALVHEF